MNAPAAPVSTPKKKECGLHPARPGKAKTKNPAKKRKPGFVRSLGQPPNPATTRFSQKNRTVCRPVSRPGGGTGNGRYVNLRSMALITSIKLALKSFPILRKQGKNKLRNYVQCCRLSTRKSVSKLVLVFFRKFEFWQWYIGKYREILWQKSFYN